MNTEAILAELVAERDRINSAIAALGTRDSGGRTPGAKRGGRVWTPEQRQAQADRIKAAWAKKLKKR